MLDPPFDAGAENASVACALPAVTVVKVGAPGAVTEGVVVPVEPEVPVLLPPQLAISARQRQVATFCIMITPAVRSDLENAPKLQDLPVLRHC